MYDTRTYKAKIFPFPCRCDLVMTSSTHENHPREMTDCAQFVVCTSSNLGIINKNKNGKNLCFFCVDYYLLRYF